MGSRAGDEQTGKDVADPQEGRRKAGVEFAHEASAIGAGPCPGPTGRSVLPMAGPAADALAAASPNGNSGGTAPPAAT